MGGLWHVPWERKIDPHERARRLEGHQKEWETGKYKNRLEAAVAWNKRDKLVSKERARSRYIQNEFSKLYTAAKAKGLGFAETMRGAKINGGHLVARGLDGIAWDDHGKPYKKFEVVYPSSKNEISFLNVMNSPSRGESVHANSTSLVLHKDDTNWKNYSDAVFGK